MPNAIRVHTEIQSADDFTGSLTDGYVMAWNSGLSKFGLVAPGGGGGTPGGSDGQVQYNDGGAFAGDAGLTYDDATGVFTVGSGGLLLGADGQDIYTFYATRLVMTVQDSNSYIAAYYEKSNTAFWLNWIEDGGYGGDSGSLYWDFGTLDSSMPFVGGAYSFNPNGRLGIRTGWAPVNAALHIVCGDAALPGLLIKQHDNTTDAIKFTDDSDVVQFGVGADGKIKTNQTTANTNTPSGATAKKLALYDTAGTLLGFVPVYGSAW